MGKKIEVPQELMNKIIDCYVNQQLSLEKTLVTLNLPFGREPLKRLLTEQGVHIRTFKEAANHGLRGPIPQDIIEQIKVLYNQGYSIERIQKELRAFFSSDKIKKTLIKNGVTLRTEAEARQCRIEHEERKYPVNDDYPLESHNGAWLLGFIAADGYLPATKGAKYRVIITLARKDEEILYLIANELGYKGPIYQFESSFVKKDGNKALCSSLSFSSKKIRGALESYGVVNNKTFKLQRLPLLPNEYMLDFIRGYFDGDGSVYYKRKSPNMSITGANISFLIAIRDFLHDSYGLNPHIYNDHNVYDLKFFVNDSIKLGHLMYDNNYLALPRKKEKFYKIISPTSLDTPQE